jgi:hypothetical protein
MRKIDGKARVEGLSGGRSLLVLQSATGEQISLEMSPAQAAELAARLAPFGARRPSIAVGAEARVGRRVTK